MKHTLQVFAAARETVLALAISLLFSFAANAQHSSDAHSAALDKCCSFSFSFVAKDAKGGPVYDAKGDVVVSGARFRVEIPHQMIVVSDGVTQWVYNSSNDEILISGSEFSQQMASASTPLEMVVELFVGANKGYEKVLNKDKAGNLVEVVLKWAKGSYVMKILGPIVEKKTPPEMFSLDVRNFPEAVITDLRKPLL